MTRSALLFLVMSTSFLTACANDPLRTSRASLNANNAVLAKSAAQAKLRTDQLGTVSSSPEFFLGDQVIDLERGEQLPDRTGAINLTLNEALPLSAIARALSEQAGYPIVAVTDAAPRAIGRLQGHLADVLDRLRTRENITFEHRGGTILLMPAGVEIVALPAMLMPNLKPLGSSNSNRRGGSTAAATAQGAEGGTGGASSWSSPATTTGLEKFITALGSLGISDLYPGATITPKPELGIIIIKAPSAAIIGAVKKQVEERLALIRQPVKVTLRLLTLDVGNSRTLQTNLDSVWGSLFGQPARFIGNNTASALSLLRNTPTGIRPDTLEAGISTLASQNFVKSNQRFDAVLMPGYVKSVADTRVITYVREATPPGQSSSSSISSTTATVSQEDLSTGTQAQFVVMPTSKSTAEVSYTLAVSSLVALRSVTSGNVTLQQPETQSREFADKVELTSGDTIVVSSQIVETARNTGAGLFDAGLPFPGTATGDNGLQLLLVLLSAEFINPSAPQRDPATNNILRVAGASE
jgi:hypothetical protein